MEDFEQITDAKSRLRKIAAAKRAYLSPMARAEKSKSAVAHFLNEFFVSAEQCIALYWPMGDELDGRGLIARLVSCGVEVGLPAIVGAGRPLVFRKYQGKEHLVPAVFGTSEPGADAKEITPNIIVLPLLAFDRTGARLGYGGGFYDLTIAAMTDKPLLVGLAFDVQEVDIVPVLAHDVPLNMIITETGVRRFKNESLSG